MLINYEIKCLTNIATIITFILLMFLELVIEGKFKIKERILNKVNPLTYLVFCFGIAIVIQSTISILWPEVYSNPYVKWTLFSIGLFFIINLNGYRKKRR